MRSLSWIHSHKHGRDCRVTLRLRKNHFGGQIRYQSTRPERSTYNVFMIFILQTMDGYHFCSPTILGHRQSQAELKNDLVNAHLHQLEMRPGLAFE